MIYYVRVAFYDERPDIEEYESIEEAQEAYATALEQSADCVLGDVCTISMGNVVDGKMKRITAKEFA